MGEAGDVDVWVVPSTSATADAPVLDSVERKRAAALDPGRRAAFVTARVLLRLAVAHGLGCAPGEVRLDATCRCGRPHGPVTVLPAGPWVSISRNGPVVAVALRTSGPVGIDVASVAAVAWAPLDRLLGPGAEGLGPTDAADPPRADTGALARTWVRTEATLKMLRTGLRRDPADLWVDASGLARLDGREVGRVVDLAALPGAMALDADVVAAIAVDAVHAVEVTVHDGLGLLDRHLARGPGAQ